jgi:hypothetical protein
LGSDGQEKGTNKSASQSGVRRQKHAFKIPTLVSIRTYTCKSDTFFVFPASSTQFNSKLRSDVSNLLPSAMQHCSSSYRSITQLVNHPYLSVHDRLHTIRLSSKRQLSSQLCETKPWCTPLRNAVAGPKKGKPREKPGPTPARCNPVIRDLAICWRHR